MTHRKLSGFLGLLFVAALAGCEGSSPSAPTLPSTPSTPAPQPTVRPTPGRPAMLDVTLSGVVFELTPSGRAPIEGATLHCGACGAETHAWAYTDSNGFYEFIGVWPDGLPVTVIWVDKDGFGDPPGLPTPGLPRPYGPGSRAVTIHGDTRFDIELVRR
jgi:hypothetical protein